MFGIRKISIVARNLLYFFLKSYKVESEDKNYMLNTIKNEFF